MTDKPTDPHYDKIVWCELMPFDYVVTVLPKNCQSYLYGIPFSYSILQIDCDIPKKSHTTCAHKEKGSHVFPMYNRLSICTMVFHVPPYINTLQFCLLNELERE